MVPGENNAWGDREQNRPPREIWASQQGFLSSKLVQLKLGQTQSYPWTLQTAPPALPSPAWLMPSAEGPTGVVIVQVTGKTKTYTDAQILPHTSKDQLSEFFFGHTQCVDQSWGLRGPMSLPGVWSCTAGPGEEEGA